MSDSAPVRDVTVVPGRNGGTLRPWQPGQSGNIAGTPNPLKAVQLLCRDKSLKSAETLAAIAADENEDSARRICSLAPTPDLVLPDLSSISQQRPSSSKIT